MSDHAEHGDSHYVKIWAILLGLLIISFIGPMAEIQWLTLATAFGIAIVKAYLVAVNFMHVNLTPRYVIYTVATTLVFMLLFCAGAAPDVMKSHGTNWEKPSWIEAEKAYAAEVAAGGGYGHEPGVFHHEAPANEHGSGSAKGGEHH